MRYVRLTNQMDQFQFVYPANKIWVQKPVETKSGGNGNKNFLWLVTIQYLSRSLVRVSESNNDHESFLNNKFKYT